MLLEYFKNRKSKLYKVLSVVIFHILTENSVYCTIYYQNIVICVKFSRIIFLRIYNNVFLFL